jgi:hypothetical protein
VLYLVSITCTPVSSTNKTERHDISEILLKVALNTITLTPIYLLLLFFKVIVYCRYSIYVLCTVSLRMNTYLFIKTSITPSLFIEVLVPSQESEWSCICMLGVSIWHLSIGVRQCGTLFPSFY